MRKWHYIKFNFRGSILLENAEILNFSLNRSGPICLGYPRASGRPWITKLPRTNVLRITFLARVHFMPKIQIAEVPHLVAPRLPSGL